MKTKATVVRFGPPVDIQGNVFAPGSVVAAVNVPVIENFDYSRVVGRASVHADGSADLELKPGIELIENSDVSLGFRVTRSDFDGDVRVIVEAETICLGVSVREGV